MNKVIALLKSMLSLTGTIIKSKSGNGFNLYGLNHDTLDIDAINDCLTEQGIAMEATHFPAKNVFDNDGNKIDDECKPECVYVGPPSEKNTSDDELTKLMQSYKS
tara:strand:- start:773 stop:1087 length:315 start_codon:yes stop_codon:yes gene_type:complete